jgi:hypothetical protein
MSQYDRSAVLGRLLWKCKLLALISLAPLKYGRHPSTLYILALEYDLIARLMIQFEFF